MAQVLRHVTKNYMPAAWFLTLLYKIIWWGTIAVNTFFFQGLGTFVPTGFVLPKLHPCWYVYSDLHIFYFRVLKMYGGATMIYNQIFCVLCYSDYWYPVGHLLSQWEKQCELLIIQCYSTNNVFLNINIFFIWHK